MGDDYERRCLAEWLRAQMARATGRAYRIDVDRLDTESLRELQRRCATSTPSTAWPSSGRGFARGARPERAACPPILRRS